MWLPYGGLIACRWHGVRRGVRHPLVTVVAISVCAALAGARSVKAIAEWAKDLSRNTLRRLGSQRWRPPSEPTIRRVLQKSRRRPPDGWIVSSRFGLRSFGRMMSRR